MVAIDATILTLFLRPESGAPLASDGKRIADAPARIEHLIQTLSESGEIVIIPTPALSEALVRVDSAAALKIIAVVIARVHQARVIYSDDADIRAIAKRLGIDVIGVADLQLPPESDQMGFEL